MSCGPTIGGVELVDADTGKVREKIELLVKDSKGKPLQFASGDIEQAVVAGSGRAPFHPVREYLEGLQWDGMPSASRRLRRTCSASSDGAEPGDAAPLVHQRWRACSSRGARCTPC
jgi:predicted P-loop ATPase